MYYHDVLNMKHLVGHQPLLSDSYLHMYITLNWYHMCYSCEFLLAASQNYKKVLQ